MGMQAVVMAGGWGQRLRPLTLKRPKPLVPLFGRPLLCYLVHHLHERGVEEVWVTAGHLGDQIEAYLATLPTDARLRCHVEARPRGTAGAVADLLGHLESPFLVISGDAIIDLDLESLLDAHHADGNVATICLAPAGERLRFGTIALAGRRVERFVEKPPLCEVAPGACLNTGCYILDHEALRGVAGEQPVDFALDVFPALLGRGLPVGAVAAARYWRDIGTLEAYREAHFDGLSGRLPWPLPPGADTRAGAAEAPVRVGRGVRVADGAEVRGPAVLGDGCVVGPGATVERSVLLDGVRVSAGATLRDCVVDAGALVPPGVHLAAAGLAGAPRGGVLGFRRVPAGRPTPASGAAADGAARPAVEALAVRAAPPQSQPQPG